MQEIYFVWTGIKFHYLLSNTLCFFSIQPPDSVKIGDYVAAPFENDVSWYRAKVMEIKDDELDLFYMDYGDSGYLTKDKVRPLR